MQQTMLNYLNLVYTKKEIYFFEGEHIWRMYTKSNGGALP